MIQLALDLEFGQIFEFIVVTVESFDLLDISVGHVVDLLVLTVGHIECIEVDFCCHSLVV